MTDYMISKSDHSICVLNNTLNAGGAEKNCVILCNELVKKGFEVELWITRLCDSPLLKIIDNRVKIRSIPGKRVRNTFVHLKEMLIKSSSKTFLIYNIELLVPVFFINKLYRLNLKIVARSISTLSYNYNDQGIIGKRLWFRLIGYTGNKIDTMIAQSQGMKEDLVKEFNISESKIKVIPNPSYNLIDNSPFSSNNIINKKDILFVGRLTKAKGFDYLLEIFQIAKSKIPDLHLTIVGTGELLQDIENKVTILGLSESISFEGYQSDLASYYKNTKATILTSVFEGFPNVLVESISYGTPVISFDCQSGPRDIIIPNVNGILVNYLNVSEFAQAIIDVVEGKIKFNKEEIIRSSQRYSLDSIVSQYEELLFN